MPSTSRPAAHSLRQLDSEVILLTAPSREQVRGRVESLLAALRRHPELPLRDIAFSVGRDADPRQECLSLVAATVSDLVRKLERAGQKLADPACLSIHDKAGVYYATERLGRRGKVAWMFPGEGAQYPNMLRDLAIQFPEVRARFDLVDRACREENARFLPSQYVFPPPGGALPSEGEDLQAWDAAVMAVIAANSGVATLLHALEVKPDATVGHSFGDFAALELGGILRGDEADRLPLIRLAYRQIQEISTFPDIPPAVLLNVGGAERATIDALLARHAGVIDIAMANCPHQYILCVNGPEREAVAQSALQFLAAEGAFAAPLPFHRPYHTARFAPAMVVERAFYTHAGVHPPTLDVYSCCTADRFPRDAETIIDIATRHWASPIRFEETIERMYQDGVRIFVEAGARGNLSAFVGDILRDRPHLAAPVDREIGSSVTHLHHALAMLAAHGVHLRIERLHRDRGSRALDLEAGTLPVDAVRARTMPMGVQCPPIDATRYLEEVGPLSKILWAKEAGQAALAVQGTQVAAGVLTAAAAPARAWPQPWEPSGHPVIAAYQETMSRFLSVQEAIASRLRERSSATAPLLAPAGGPALAPGSQPVHSWPLLGTIVSLQPGEALEAVALFDVEEHRFLLDHTLGRGISAFDPELQGVPVMPLLFATELMAEAAMHLIGPGQVVISIDDVRANRAILFERGRTHVRTTAKVIPSPDDYQRVRVEIREDDPADGTAAGATIAGTGARFRPSSMEATIVLAEHYPEPPAHAPLPLQAAEPCGWSPAEIYRRTFHGPSLQGIRGVDSIAANGLIGRMEVMPRHTYLRSNPAPAMTYDPVLADSMGQTVRVWANRIPDVPRFYLPFHTDALSLYAPPLPPGTPLRVNLEIHADADGVIRSSITALDERGTTCVRMTNLRDRAFEIPPALKRMLLSPQAHAFSDVWTPPPAVGLALPPSIVFTRLAGFPRADLLSGYAIWLRVWAFLVLSPPERSTWIGLGPVSRRIDWLWARTAAKDAVRELCRAGGGPNLGAADIVLEDGAEGALLVAGGWKGRLPVHPRLAIAASGDLTLAMAWDVPAERAPGFDAQKILDNALAICQSATGETHEQHR